MVFEGRQLVVPRELLRLLNDGGLGGVVAGTLGEDHQPALRVFFKYNEFLFFYNTTFYNTIIFTIQFFFKYNCYNGTVLTVKKLKVPNMKKSKLFEKYLEF